METSDKKWSVALILLFVCGAFGGHRYYTGHIKTGILMTCTLGCCGLMCWYDLYLLLTNKFTDVDGKPLAK